MEKTLETYEKASTDDVLFWFKAAKENDFPKNGGACIKYKGKQIAVFNFDRKKSWYACQNVCPHKMEMVLSRGMIGDQNGIPKVACPIHKKTFSLENGENLNGELTHLVVYPVKIENGNVYIGFSE